MPVVMEEDEVCTKGNGVASKDQNVPECPVKVVSNGNGLDDATHGMNYI